MPYFPAMRRRAATSMPSSCSRECARQSPTTAQKCARSRAHKHTFAGLVPMWFDLCPQAVDLPVFQALTCLFFRLESYALERWLPNDKAKVSEKPKASNDKCKIYLTTNVRCYIYIYSVVTTCHLLLHPSSTRPQASPLTTFQRCSILPIAIIRPARS